jgi:hypothetical protein
VWDSFEKKIFFLIKNIGCNFSKNTAEYLMGESRYDEALRQANVVWELIKENRKEDIAKVRRRNMMGKLYKMTTIGKKPHISLVKTCAAI